MEDAMEAYLLARPDFVDDGTSVTVTLSTTSTVTPEERAWLLGLDRDESFSPEERRLLLFAAREGSVTNGRARAALGIDSVEARRVLVRLRDRGILVQHGARGGAQYVLASGLTPPGARIFTPADLRSTIIDLARTGAVTNEQVRDATGLDRAAVTRALQSLVDDRVLERHGERRGTTYTLASS
jgi:predicted HTH transcriptional regulator